MTNQPKPTCPYCSGEREMLDVTDMPFKLHDDDVEEWCGYYRCTNCGSESPRAYGATRDEARQNARAAAMKRAELPNRVLTTAELEQLYITFDENPRMVCLELRARNKVEYCIPCGKIDNLDISTMNKQWRCWLRKPTDAERVTVKWA